MRRRMMQYQALPHPDGTGWYIATADVYAWDIGRGRRFKTFEEAKTEALLWEREDNEAREELEANKRAK
jgi:hypothetical protein